MLVAGRGVEEQVFGIINKNNYLIFQRKFYQNDYLGSAVRHLKMNNYGGKVGSCNCFQPF